MKNDSRMTEQRQHLNLSAHALYVLDCDLDIFAQDDNKSGFINRIILNYREESEASISLCLQRFKEKAKAVLSRDGLTKAEERMIEDLALDYAEQAKKRMHSFAKGSSPLKIRLQNEVYDELYPIDDPFDWPEKDYYNSQGEYIKALFEDYASKPFFEREAIYYAENLNKLKAEIERDDKIILSVTYRTSNNQLSVYDVKPYKLSTASEAEYNYCVCCRRKAGDGSRDFKPALLRLSRIEKIKEHAKSYGSGKITAEQKKQIEKILDERGINFFTTDDTATFRIKLTPQGWNMYHVTLHNRPAAKYVEELADGSRVLTIESTSRQMEIYFLRYGKDAILLSPESMKEKFAAHYAAAADAYGQSG